MKVDYEERGVLLRKYDLSDTSLITRWLTQQHGIITVAAKGAKRKNSAFFGKLELFSSVEIAWKPARTGDLGTLNSLDVISYREALRTKYSSLVCASYFAALIDHSLEQMQPSEESFDLLNRGLSYLETNDLGEKELLFFETELSRILGYSTIPSEVRKLYQENCNLMDLRKRVLKR